MKNKKIVLTTISTLNTANVTNMEKMFQYCSKLTSLDLSHFDTSKVTSVAYMFGNCTLLATLNINSFDLSNVTTSAGVRNMFTDCAALTELTTPAVMSPQTITLPSTLYTQDNTAYSSLTSTTPVKTVLKTS